MTLTVFTPAFNRADLLPRGYKALLRQTSHDFCWLIIDDGSKDNTRELVRSWFDPVTMNEDGDHITGVSKEASWLQMHYCYKENGGLHTGYNKAIELMESEICVCIDSDDYMPDDAVEFIVSYWQKHRHENIAGFTGKDYLISGRQLGADFPEDAIMHLIELRMHKQWNKDNKTVMRVDLLKKVAPQPTFPGEKNFNPYYLMLKIDQMFPFRMVNKNLCFVDYQENGMAANIIKQFFSSPNSFVELRRLYVTLDHTSLKWRFRQYVHLSAECLIARRNPFKLEGVNVLYLILSFPIGLALYIYLNLNKNKKKKMN